MSKNIIQHKKDDLVLSQRVGDGYINLNDVAKSTGKRVDVWLRINRTKELLKEFDKQNSDSTPLKTSKGGAGRGGTWAHPAIASEFKDWCVRKRNSQPTEKLIQEKLAKRLDGDMEVPVTMGVIDVLTKTEVIEVKRISSWMHAVGQILIYSQDYPDLQKRIHLFGKVSPAYLELIKARCAIFDIDVTWEL